MPKFSVVIPCYNEADNLSLLLDRFAKFVDQWDFELIIVNNGSTDDTKKVLHDLSEQQQYGFCRSVHVPKNIGYGDGIYKGLLASKGQVLAYTHGDIQTPPEDVFAAFEKYQDSARFNERILIKGLRPGRDQTHVLTRGLTKITNMLLGYKFEDINAQPKVFPRDLLDVFDNPTTDFSFDTYVLYKAKLAGFRIIEISVDFDRRLHGESKWASSIRAKYKTIYFYIMSILKFGYEHREDSHNLIGQVLRFIVVGLYAVTTHYLVFCLLYLFFSMDYRLASMIGFLSGFVVGFYFNSKYTFKINEKHRLQCLAKYGFVNMFSLFANLLTIVLLVELFGIYAELSQLVAIGVSIVINFVGQKLWVFKIEDRQAA